MPLDLGFHVSGCRIEQDTSPIGVIIIVVHVDKDLKGTIAIEIIYTV